MVVRRKPVATRHVGDGCCSLAAEIRCGGGARTNPLAKKTALEEDGNCDCASVEVVVALVAPVALADRAAIWAAFKVFFLAELKASLPDMVERSLGRSISKRRPLSGRDTKLAARCKPPPRGACAARHPHEGSDVRAHRGHTGLEDADVHRWHCGRFAPVWAGFYAIDGPLSSCGGWVVSRVGTGGGSSSTQGHAAPGIPTSHEGHLVLMKFASRGLRGNMDWIEKSARSPSRYVGHTPAYSALRHGSHLTLHFTTHEAADKYSGLGPCAQGEH